MKEIKSNIRTFCYRDDWFVEVVQDEEFYEAWLYNKRCGIKSFMIGLPHNNIGIQIFLITLEISLEVHSYIQDYIETYM